VNFDDKLTRVIAHYDELRALAADHPDPGSPEYTAMLKEYAELTPVVESIEALRQVQGEMQDLAELLADPETEAEMRALAEEDCPRTKPTRAMRFSRYAPAPAGRRPRSSPPSCSACTSATPSCTVGASRLWAPRTPGSAG
jgi:hypothetical protein